MLSNEAPRESDGGSGVWGIFSEFSNDKITENHRVKLWSVYLRLGPVFHGFIINTIKITFRGSTNIELKEVVFKSNQKLAKHFSYKSLPRPISIQIGCVVLS